MAVKMIDAKQIQLIHIAKAQLGLSEEEYRTCIEAQTKGKKNSSKELTYFEADHLINYFRTLGFKIESHYIRTSGAAKRAYYGPANSRSRRPRKAETVQDVIDTAHAPADGRTAQVFMLATRDQLDMIEALKNKISWRLEDGFQRWLGKYLKIKRVKTLYEAQDCIEGLKGLLIHQDGVDAWNNG